VKGAPLLPQSFKTVFERRLNNIEIFFSDACFGYEGNTKIAN